MSTNNAKQVQVMGRFLQGLSAYEVAVKNGFEGTEKEWLASVGGDVASVNGQIGHVRLDIPTDEHINGLINTALGVIENGSY